MESGTYEIGNVKKDFHFVLLVCTCADEVEDFVWGMRDMLEWDRIC